MHQSEEAWHPKTAMMTRTMRMRMRMMMMMMMMMMMKMMMMMMMMMMMRMMMILVLLSSLLFLMTIMSTTEPMILSTLPQLFIMSIYA